MIEKLVEQIEARFAERRAQMSDPEVIADRERYAEVGRAYRAARAGREARRGVAPRAVDDAAGARELLAEGGDDAERARDAGDAPRRDSTSSRRRSASRWSSATPTTTRT